MILKFIKLLVRNLLKHKIFSVVNIIGLAVGMTLCFLITMFIITELSYDRFYQDHERLYRVYIDGEINGQPVDFAVTMGPLANTLAREFQEVQYATTVERTVSKVVVKYKDRKYFEDSILSASNDFFQVFSYKLLRGDKNSVLSEPQTIVISESLAKKYFGNNDPLGKVLTVDNSEDYKVAGVMADIPVNSHLQFDVLVSFTGEYDEGPANWGAFSVYTYLKLSENVDPVEFETKIRNLAIERMGIDPDVNAMAFYLHLEPVCDIHLHSRLSYNMGNEGNIIYVYVFSVIALFILFLACINFINLTTAHYSIRAKEIGIRKIVGADRRRLIQQFLWETILLVFISALVAFVLIELLLPVFNSLTGKELNFQFMDGWQIILLGLVFVLFTGITAGLYPAFYLSGINPLNIMRGKLISGIKKHVLRNILVVFQFIISITLIISTLIIYRQVSFYQTKELGFDKEHVLIMSLLGSDMQSRANLMKEEFVKIPGIETASISSNFPGAGAVGGHGFQPEGYSEDQPRLFKEIMVDHDFMETFRLKMKEGRFFSREFANDAETIIINETLAEELGWDEPLGKTLIDPMRQHDGESLSLSIIGVVKDFHINPLSQEIEPTVLYISDRYQVFLSLRLASGDVFSLLDKIEFRWNKLNPEMPFDYFFLNERFNRIHRSERDLGRMLLYFSILAVFIASLGLFGLSAYVIQRRLREIGIRKVLGSTLKDNIFLLSKDFNKLILISNLIAWPLAYFLMSKWLENFAYRARLSIWIFFLAAFIAMIIASLTIGYQTLKAARVNPVKILKYE